MTAQNPRVRGWTLRRRFGQLSVVVALVIALFVLIVGFAMSRFVLAGNEVIYRWQPALLVSQQLLGDLVNEETGVRGYELTRNPASLQPYEAALPLEAADRARLNQLVGGDDQLRALVQVVIARADRWKTDYAVPVIARLDEGGSPVGIAGDDAGRSLFDRIRAANEPLDIELSSRVAEAERNRLVTGIIAAVAVAVGIAVLLVAGQLTRRGLVSWVLRPVGYLAAQTRIVAAGQLSYRIEPLGPDELRRLGEDVEAMRAQLVAELARAESISADLRRQGAELERSNADLQQFAYVASHDLSEPLRKVSNFCQLLERQYGPQLDDRARQYIDFAVDGARRLQALINDLLALSRVGRTTESFVPVKLDDVLDRALSTLAEKIREAGATVERASALPEIAGDRSLLVSLFENLIGNAVKYRRDDVATVVRITAERAVATDERSWTVRISDNGIGIDPQYAERIFAVFQRLHLRDQYGGTGIGLALCRRIVEYHGGEIHLDADSRPSAPGATFVINLPEGSPRASKPVRSP